MHRLSVSLSLLLLLLFLLPFLSLAAPNLTYPGFQLSPACDASLGQCDPQPDFLMDSQINRRILAAANSISYSSLSANRVPCSAAGRSYYGCASSGPANPYSRSCSRITKCYRDTS